MNETKKNCKTCVIFNECKDSVWSWVFLFIGLLATISIRLVTLVLPWGQFWSKLFWYIGVTGFFIYFLYKFKQDRAIRLNLMKVGIVQRIVNNQPLNSADYEFLRATLCHMRSLKDLINYLVIFSTSGLVLFLALFQDLTKK